METSREKTVLHYIFRWPCFVKRNEIPPHVQVYEKTLSLNNHFFRFTPTSCIWITQTYRKERWKRKARGGETVGVDKRSTIYALTLYKVAWTVYELQRMKVGMTAWGFFLCRCEMNFCHESRNFSIKQLEAVHFINNIIIIITFPFLARHFGESRTLNCAKHLSD